MSAARGPAGTGPRMTGRGALTAVAIVVAAILAAACTPDGGQTAAPPASTAPTTTVPTCDTRNEDSVASYRPDGITAEAAKAQTIRKDRLVVGVSADTNLIGFRDQDAKLVGFDVDIAREIARHLFGDPDAIELKVLTVPRRIPALQAGEVDIVVNSLTVTCQRWDQIEFSTEYLRSGQKLLVRIDDALNGIETIDQFAGRRVCASRGGTGAANIRTNFPKVQLVEVEDRGDCLVKFQRGETDAILNGDNLLAGFVPQDRYAAKIVGNYLNQEPTAVGVKKGNVDLTRYVNLALEDIRRTSWAGTYDRWLRPVLQDPPQGFSPPPAVYGRTP
jgi:polar amino acid transport system substrate-binding protein